MFDRSRWVLAVTGVWALLVFLHARAAGLVDSGVVGAVPFRWLYGGSYFLLGVLMIAAAMRLRPALTPALGRAYTVLGGAALGGIEAIVQAPASGSTQLELWMAGLLGLALAAMAVRFAPAPLASAWMDRPQEGPGP